MKNYWDTSALIIALHTPEMRAALDPSIDSTRIHTFTELFCTLTKGVTYRYAPDDAAKMISDLAESLCLVELTKADVLEAIDDAGSLGVRGARIHDLIHARAARKFGARTLITLDTPGFTALDPTLTVQPPPSVE